MKYKAALILTLCLFLISGPAAAKSKAKAPAGPKVSIEETVYEADGIVAGSKVSHDFTIKNVGSADLEIIQVVPGCGCSVASFDKVIAPGQSGRITLEVEMYEEWAGRKVTQSALVETNDPDRQYLSLAISADLSPKQ